MTGGLREYWNLPAMVPDAKRNGEFQQSFRAALEGLNHDLQVIAVRGGQAEHQMLEASRQILIAAFQKVAQSGDASKGRQVMDAMAKIQQQTSAKATTINAGYDEWQKRVAAFDVMVAKIADLEDAHHPKAPAYRKVSEAIQSRLNGGDYLNANTAFDQLEAKLVKEMPKAGTVTTGAKSPAYTTSKDVPGNATVKSLPGGPQITAHGQESNSGPIVPLMPTGEMHDEEVAAHIVDKQAAILQGWETALHVFDKTMTSESDKEAKPDFQGVVLKHFRDKAVGELFKKVKFASEIKALADAIDAEIQRAAKAQASATLRDFVNQHAKDIGKLTQKLLAQRQGFISAVRKRREMAGIDTASPNSAKHGNKKPKGQVEVNPKHLEEWTNMRLALMDTLEAIDKSLSDATPEKLLRVLTEAWIRQGTVGKLAGQPIAAVVIIRLNPNMTVKNAHIMASGGQKLAEQLLKDSPQGVDVFGLMARRRILHYGDNNWPQATLELDENNRDLTAPADRNGKYDALKKHVFSKGLAATRNISGD